MTNSSFTATNNENITFAMDTSPNLIMIQSWRDRSKGTQVLKINKKGNEYFCSTFVDKLTQSVFVRNSESTVN